MERKKLKKFNELYQNTYWSASNKVGHGTERSNKLQSHATKMGIYKDNPFMENVVLNMFMVVAVNNDDGEEIFPNKVMQFKMPDGFEQHEPEFGNFTLSNMGEDNIHGWININFYDNKLIIDLGNYLEEPGKKYTKKSNLFADRKSMKSFMKVLESLYITHNPNTSRNGVANINKTKVKSLTHEDYPDTWDNFWKFLDQNGYDWKKFKSEINTNKLWDDLMPEKKRLKGNYDSNWVSNNT
tara:strand:+ start:1655 stop:2374 length:720 start_codon:yes stop_codon:yes gene_type:complete